MNIPRGEVTILGVNHEPKVPHVIDLTSSGKKTKPFQLYLDRAIAFEVQAKAGIKVTPNRSYSSNTGYSYFITLGAARKLAKAYPDSITYYGRELPAELREFLS